MQTNTETRGTYTGPQPPEFDPAGAMEGSEFLAKVREKFYKPGGQSDWPGTPAHDHDDRAKAELPAALDALFKCAAFDVELPAAPPETAMGRLKAAADEVDWPDSAIPEDWPAEEDEAYRLYEVACAVNIMIRAFNDSAGGGGPRPYPPPTRP